MPAQRQRLSSVQFNVQPPLSDRIIQWGLDHFHDEDIFTDLDNDFYGLEDEPHVTVLYGLHTDDPEPVAKLLRQVRPFSVMMGPHGVFSSKEVFDVVMIEVISRELMRLNAMLRRQLPHTTAYEYHPHLTLAYLKKGKAWQYRKHDCFANEVCWVKELVFSGPHDKVTLPLNTDVSY